MIAVELQENIQRVKNGEWDNVLESYFEGMSAKKLFSELQAEYPIVFQKRQVGQKQEIGLAKEVIYGLRFRAPSPSPMMVQSTRLTYRNCLLVSEYANAVSEITWLKRVDVLRARHGAKGLRLRFSEGFKADKTVDGWHVKALFQGDRLLSMDVLKKHGWQFGVLQPFGLSGLVSP